MHTWKALWILESWNVLHLNVEILGFGISEKLLEIRTPAKI